MKKIIAGMVLLFGMMLFTRCNVVKREGVFMPQVSTLSGVLQGTSNGFVESFKGIPYAAAPTGDLRWRAPQAVTPWNGIRDASKFCSDCAQVTWPYEAGKIQKNSSEDCLYLNIWRPANLCKEQRLPVMVWIHGGSFVGGGGSEPYTTGDHFAEQGIILVSINYRLGRFGHFAFPALSAEYPEEPKGSYAHMDQIAALQWVRDNIASFGGDKNNVTIFGESAGGLSVQSLLTMSAAKGLFHKAIVQSGGGRDGGLTGRPIRDDNADPYHPVSAESIGLNFARKRGIKGVDVDALVALRALPMEKVVGGGEEIFSPTGDVSTYSGPIIDGQLLTETPEHAYKQGKQIDVPLMIGFNSAEIPAGLIHAESKSELFSKFAPFDEEAILAYDPDGKKTLAELLTMVNTDRGWGEQARFTARAFTEKGSHTYFYLFDYVPSAFQHHFIYGTPHAAEIPFVFNTLKGRIGIRISANDREVASMMNTYWVNFAKTGDPNGSGLAQWSKHDLQHDHLLEIKRDGTAVSKPNPSKKRFDVIEKTLRTLK